MQLTGEQRIAAPRAKVWEALNDPAVLRQCIPGCQSLEKEADDRLRATAEIKIGPIGARFSGLVTLSDLDPPNGYTITGEGQGGMAGSAKGGAKVRLTDDAGGTKLAYDVEAQVAGRLAQLGGPIIDATAKQLAGQFFKKFGAIVEGPGATAPAPAPAPVASAVSPATAPAYAPARPAGLPVAWLLALVVAALIGFLVGRGQSEVPPSDWMGIAIGLLLLVVGAAGVEFGRRAAGPRQ